MSALTEYLLEKNIQEIVVEKISNKNKYCFKFERSEDGRVWFIGIQDGALFEKNYSGICTINKDFKLKKNKDFVKRYGNKFDYAFGCLDFLFKYHDNEEQMKLINLHFGKAIIA